MTLTFDELRFLAVLLSVVNIIVIVYVINYVKARQKGAYGTSGAVVFAFLGLFLMDLMALNYSENLQLNPDVKQFISQAQTGIIFAFIFCWISIILLISHSFKPEYREFIWYSLLINHLSLILIIISFVIDLIPKSAQFPLPIIQEYSGLIITIIIGIIIELMRQKSHKATISKNKS